MMTRKPGVKHLLKSSKKRRKHRQRESKAIMKVDKVAEKTMTEANGIMMKDHRLHKEAVVVETVAIIVITAAVVGTGAQMIHIEVG